MAYFSEVFEQVQRTYSGAMRLPGESHEAWFERQYESRRYELVAELLRASCAPSGRVADIGAWPGHFTVCLKRLGWPVVAVDRGTKRPIAWDPSRMISTGWLETASAGALSFDELCRREGIEVMNTDIEDEPLAFADASLDAVILTEVIEHVWRNPLYVLAQINRVLKLNTGVLILSTPNLLSLRHRINFVRGRIDEVIEHPFVSFLKVQRVGHLGHLRLYAPAELLDMLRLHGFECTVHYQRSQQISVAVAAPTSATNGGATAASARRSGIKKLVRRVFKSPRGYSNAVGATVLEMCEKRYPHLRGRLFVVARKIKDADFDKNFPDRLKSLVLKNTFGDA